MTLPQFRTLREGTQVKVKTLEMPIEEIGIIRKVYTRNASVAFPDHKLTVVNYKHIELCE